MPSKKSKTSSPIEIPSQENISKELDKFLPIANVSRIMKKSLPPNAKISKEAKETVQECVSEFISFVTGEASDRCQREKRKTINGDDLLWAMTTLGFDNYVGPLKLYLNKYREIEGEKSNNIGSPASNNPANPNSSESLSVNHNGINKNMDKGSSASHFHVTNKLDFENFNGSRASSFYSLSAQKSYVNIGGASFGVNNFNTVVDQDIHGGGEDDQSANVGPHLQYGIGW